MPDTPGKRQRREVKAKRRNAKDERRAARIMRRDDPNAGLEGQQLLDENGFPVFDEDGYPVLVPHRDADEAQPDAPVDDASTPSTDV